MSDRIIYGYIYIRENQWWDELNIFKCGYTIIVRNRDGTYVTSEPIRGKFTQIWQIETLNIEQIERNLHDHLNGMFMKFYGGGGTEFFKKEGKTLIEPYFDSENIKYKLLTNDEVNELNQYTVTDYPTFIPCDYQNEIVDYCDKNNAKIDQLKEEIESNKVLIKSYLDNIICKKTEDNQTKNIVQHEKIAKPKKKKKAIPIVDEEQEQVTIEKDSNGYDILQDDDGFAYYNDEYGCQHYYDDSKNQKLLINKAKKQYREFRLNEHLYRVVNEEVFTIKDEKQSKLCGYYRNGMFISLSI